VQYTRESGSMTSRKAKASKNGLMARCTMVSTRMERKREGASFNGLTELFTLAVGRITRWMAKATSNGKMGDLTKGSMNKTRNMG